MNFCLGELFLNLLTQICEWHQILSEKTILRSLKYKFVIFSFRLWIHKITRFKTVYLIGLNIMVGEKQTGIVTSSCLVGADLGDLVPEAVNLQRVNQANRSAVCQSQANNLRECQS